MSDSAEPPKETFWRCLGCEAVYKSDVCPAVCWNCKNKTHVIALVQPADVPAARALWEGRTPAGLVGTLPRECHGCVSRDHEIERLRGVLDLVADGTDERDERILRAMAAMVATKRGGPWSSGAGDFYACGSEEPEAEYAERLVQVGLSAMKENAGS